MNFKVVKYKDIGKVRSGKRLPKGYTVSEKITKNKYIRVRDINDGYIDASLVQYITDDAAKKINNYRVNAGDVIISVVGTIGSIAQIEDALNGAYLTENCDNLLVDESICIKEYLKYYLLSGDGLKEITANTVGSTQPKLPIYGIENFNIKLPSIENQKKIVFLLETIDRKIKLNNQINDNLYEIGKLVFEEMSESFNDENSKQYKLDETLDILKDGTHNPPVRIKKGIPLITGQTLQNGFIDYEKMTYISKDEYKKIHSKYQPQEDDLIITKIGTVGKVAILRKCDIPIAVHCNSALLRFKKNIFSQYYGFWLLLSKDFLLEFNKRISKTVQDFVSLGKIAEIPIKIPNKEILNKYENLFKTIIFKISELNYENQKLGQLRDTLLPKLMNGEIDLENIEI